VFLRRCSFVRRIGYVPLIAWGVLCTTMPHKVPMHIVVGKPIELPHRADPSPAEVRRYLEQYIDALVSLFERHKAAAGHPHATLTII
jgi:2-acylglycerol O-acyltransferase 2